MISWRYHVVSIVAVILAFGLGILAGTLVVSGRFENDLIKNTNEAQDERDQALETVAIYERFAEGLQPTLRDDVLLGQEAVVITAEGVEGPARRAVEELTAAGVDVLATLQLTRRLAEPEVPENLAVLEEVLGVTGVPPDDLRTTVVEDLAVRLAVGPDADGDDVLGRLLAEGLVTVDRDLDPETLPSIGGPGPLLVLAAGGTAPPEGAPGPHVLLVPLTERLVRLAAASAVVGQREDRYGFVAAIREASDVPDCAIVTVDDVDLAIGGMALVMGLERFLEDPDPEVLPGGDYGLEGDAIVPGAEEVPGSCRR